MEIMEQIFQFKKLFEFKLKKRKKKEIHLVREVL